MSVAAAEPTPRRTWIADLRASLVVFLVALPLCLGVAVASGVPPELGLVTGIVGGLVAGALPGSTWQVSGPAAGLTVLVFGIVEEHGLTVLGPVVIVAGLLQLLLAALRLGQWFRAMAMPVVHGMLGGIGLLIISGQVLVLAGESSSGDGLADLQAIPGALLDGVTGTEGQATAALLVGGVTLALLIGWKRLPAKVQAVPGALVAIVVATAGTALLGLEAQKIELPSNFASAISFPSADGLAALADPAVLGIALALGLVASAESLLSSVAVDRMHDGPPTRFNAELAAQGAGNTVAGLLGGLPMTAVIVRSAANVEAGAQTRKARIWHGGWLLLFAAALPAVLSLIPTAALAAVLVMAGVALMKPVIIRRIRAEGPAELFVYAATVLSVFVLGLLEGVVLGVVLSGALLLRKLGGLEVEQRAPASGVTELVLSGPATFLGVPRLAAALEGQSAGTDVRLDLSAAHVVDPAARDLVEGWRERHERTGARVDIHDPTGATRPPSRASRGSDGRRAPA